MTTRASLKSVQFFVFTPDPPVDQPPQIYVSTSRDKWPEPGRPIPRLAPGVYSASLKFEAGLVIEYKFMRAGSWLSVEKADDGHEVPNRTLLIDPLLDEQLVVHRVGAWGDRAVSTRRRVEINMPGGGPPPPPRRSTLTGDIRYHYRVFSPQLKNERTVLVYLPPGYDSRPSERYPVLYMHDGDNVFDAATSVSGVEWGADETAQRLIETGQIPPLIIVAVCSTPARLDEYTPAVDAHKRGGKADAYLDFLARTLKPMIDASYRTRAEPEHTVICGASLGGLVSLYAAFRLPHVFGRAAAMSPTIGWAGGALLDFIRMHARRERPRLWIDVGTQEGANVGPIDSDEAVAACRRLAGVLDELGFASGRDYRLEVISGARHHESDWSARFDRVLQFLFAP